MLTLYVNTTTRDWADADGNPFKNHYPQMAYQSRETVKIIACTDTSDLGSATVDPTSWTRDSSWAEVSGLNAKITADSDRIHKLKGTLDDDIAAGEVTTIAATITGATTALIPEVGVIRLYDDSGDYEALAYTERAVDGTTVTFTVDGTLTGDYASGSTIDCGQAPYCEAYLDTAASDLENGEFVFDLAIDSARLRAAMDYSDTEHLSVAGLELLLYQTEDETSTPIKAFLCDTFSITGTLGTVDFEAEVPDALVDRITATISQQLEDAAIGASAVSVEDAGEYYDGENVEAALQEVGESLAENAANIATNTAAIETNAANIATNTAAIAANAEAIENLSTGSGTAATTADAVSVEDAGSFYEGSTVEEVLQEVGVSLNALETSGSGTAATTADAVSITDANDYYSGETVEAALQEVGENSYSHGMSIAEINSNINEITTTLNTLQATQITVSDVNEYYDGGNVESVLAELGASIATLESSGGSGSGASTADAVSITDAGGYYDGENVEAALQEAATKITTNAADIYTLGNTLESNAERISALESATWSASNVIVSSTNAYYANLTVEAVLTTVGENIYSLGMSINETNSNVSDIQTAVNKNASNIATNTAAIETNAANIATNTAAIAANAEAIENLSTGSGTAATTADAVSVEDAGSFYEGSTVEEVLQEVGVSLNALETSGSGTAATTADAVSITDANDYYSGETVEAALQEVGENSYSHGMSIAEINSNINEITTTLNTLQATQITVSDVNEYYDGGNVESVLAELGASITTLNGLRGKVEFYDSEGNLIRTENNALWLPKVAGPPGPEGPAGATIIADPVTEMAVADEAWGDCRYLDAAFRQLSFRGRVRSLRRVSLETVSIDSGVTGNIVLVPIVNGSELSDTSFVVAVGAVPAVAEFALEVASGTLALRRDTDDERDTLKDSGNTPVTAVVLSVILEVQP